VSAESFPQTSNLYPGRTMSGNARRARSAVNLYDWGFM
jgi:hypothetical protein